MGNNIISLTTWNDGLSLDSAAFSIFLHYGVIGALVALFVFRKIAKHYRKNKLA